MLSCGADGSIRVWAATAGGALVNKRDVGGQPTCCAAAHANGHSVLAVGSRLGTVRLVDLADLQQLRVFHQTRLFREPVCQLALSADGTHLAAAAAAPQQPVAVMRLQPGGAAAEVLGYVAAASAVLSMTWVQHAEPCLLLNLAGSKVALIPAAAIAACGGGSVDAAAHTAAAPVELLALAALPQHPSSTTSSSTELVALSQEGHLHWLQLPPGAAGWAPGHTLQSVSRLILPVPGVRMALSADREQLVVMTRDGALLTLPAAAAAAEHAVASESGISTTAAIVAADMVPMAALALSAGCAWCAVGGADGSLVLHSTGLCGARLPPAGHAHAAVSGCDVDAPDDDASPTAGDQAAAAAAAAAHSASAGARQATLAKLQDLQDRLAQVRACPLIAHGGGPVSPCASKPGNAPPCSYCCVRGCAGGCSQCCCPTRAAAAGG
jgi:hypothetical protein